MIDLEEFGKQIGALIREAVGPLEARIKELETALEASESLDVAEVVTQVLGRPELKTLVDLQAAESVGAYFAENPVQHGKDGENGKDGVGLAGAVIDRDGGLILTLTNGEAKSLGAIVGKDGTDGLNGKDGIAFDEASGEFIPDRGYVIRLANGARSTELVLPYMRHGGFWSEGKTAVAGESMTHDGALWIAKRQTAAKPCAENSDDWILAARKGRDGRDGRNGVDKTAPVKVGGNG